MIWSFHWFHAFLDFLPEETEKTNISFEIPGARLLMENLQDIKGGEEEGGVYKRKSIETRRYVGREDEWRGEGRAELGRGCEKKKNGKE